MESIEERTERETREREIQEEKERLERVKWVEELYFKDYQDGNVEKYRSGQLSIKNIPLGADVRFRGIGQKAEIEAAIRKEIPHLTRCCLDLRRDGQDYVEAVFEVDSQQTVTGMENLLFCPWLVKIEFCAIRAYACS